MSSQILAAILGQQTAAPLFPIGQIYVAPTGERFLYGVANGALTVGTFQIQSSDAAYSFQPLTTALVGTPKTNWANLGVATGTMTDTYYGWFWIGFGYYTCVIENSFAAADKVYTTANAGIPGTNSSSHVLDGFKSIAAGVTSTRVGCIAAGRLTAGVAQCGYV